MRGGKRSDEGGDRVARGRAVQTRSRAIERRALLLDPGPPRPQSGKVIRRVQGWVGLLVVAAGCVSGRSERPPNVAPAPSSAAISNVGFDQAVKLGSDYVYANTGVSNPTVASSQTLPGGMLELTFDLGPGVPEPARVVIDQNAGKVNNPNSPQPVPGVIDTTSPKR